MPASQRVQMPAPGDPVALPGRQSRQTLTFELPGIGLALPAGHAMHEVLSDAPSSALYVPAGHCSKVIDADAAPTDRLHVHSVLDLTTQLLHLDHPVPEV